MAARPKKPDPTLEWVYDGDGRRISELDFTMEDCERLDEMTGMTWSVSFPMASPKAARCWLEVAFGRLGLEEPAVKAKAVTWRRAMLSFKAVELSLPEFDEPNEAGDIPFVGPPPSTG